MGMPRPSRLLAATVLLAAAACAQFALARKKDKANAGPMDAHKRAVHALNRLSFGPRPGDVDQVARMGVDKWIELQLHPDRIDDSALDAKLAPLRTLRMDTKEIVENFPPNQLIKEIADGKAALPRDPSSSATKTKKRKKKTQARTQQQTIPNRVVTGLAPSQPMASNLPIKRAAANASKGVAKLDQKSDQRPRNSSTSLPTSA
jgi:hypothetical protein